MSRPFIPLCLALAPVLAVAACSPSAPERQDKDGYIRLPLPTEPAAPDLAPQQPEGGQWSTREGTMNFGLPGQPAMLSISCTHSPDGKARLHFVRRARAEEGAQALFAIEGNLHVARVPMNVTRAGDPGEWQGDIDAHAETAGAIKGDGQVTATLPGGGALKLARSSEPGHLLDACRASDAKARSKPEPEAQP